jgi:uncharacterized cupin superfamily protein
MAKQKAASRSAAQTAVKKKWAGHKAAAKSSARKAVKSKARAVPAVKPSTSKSKAAKPSSNKPSSSKPSSSKPSTKSRIAKKARPKQRIAISHHREEDFKADGLRTYAQYRDLGISDASHGLAQAHVIRLIGPCNPAEVSKLHYHDVEFQMVYVLKGWVKTYLEGQGETLMKQGSAWTQPPRIKHLIMDYSDDVELLEVILPAEFKTVELAS